jgi:ketosteroid isomerase-like protein
MRSYTRSVLFFLTVAAATVACMDSKSETANNTHAPNPRAMVESTTTAFHQALRTNDSATFYAFIADDVIINPPGEQSVRGKDAVRSWYSAFLKQYQTSKLTLGEREVFVGDGWATEVGSYEWGLKPTAGGAEVVDRGHYMQVWKHNADGKWQFAREIWNSSTPPTT